MALLKVRSGATQQSSDVRFSDRGYAYAEKGQSGEIRGLIAFGPAANRPSLKQIPNGILFFNTDTRCLELSDPENDQWICIQTGTAAKELGLPTDGSFHDGVLPLEPDMSVADAVDAINEYLVGCCVEAEYASHLGTTDGNTNGFLQDPVFTLGRVASPDSPGSPFYTNSWDNNINRDITNINNLGWNLQSGEKITDLQSGVLSIEIINGNLDVIHTDSLNLDGTLNDQSSSPDSLISVNLLEVQADRIEGYLSVSIPSNAILGTSGYLKVIITHEINSDIYNQELEFFFDAGNSPSIIDQDVSLGTTVKKYLSGVAFASISGSSASELVFSGSMSDIWKDTYRADPLVILPDDFGITTFTVPYNSVNVTKEGVSPPTAPFSYDEDFVYSQSVEISNTNVINPDEDGFFSQISFTVRDPFSVVPGAPMTPLILINTHPQRSTDTLEVFLDEEYRLTPNSGVSALSSIFGLGRGGLIWDSTESLVSSSGLQVINGSLIYPQDDFSSFAPTPNPDYSSLPSLLGDEVYIRRFRDSTGASRSNGIFLLQGLSESDRTLENILIDIRVVGTHVPGNGVQGPGNEGTGWLSLNKDFNSATFKGDDGDGCFVTVGGYSSPYFEFTLGTFSTGFAANQAIEVRITYKNPVAVTRRLKRLEITNWN